MADATLIVRPPTSFERGYVYASARARIVARNGERFVDYKAIVAMVDAIIDRCSITLALFEGVLDDHGRPEIHGFAVVDARDESVEFFHMRKLYRDMTSSDLAGRVARGLLRDRENVVLRRGPSDEALKAIIAAGCTPIVRPRSV